MSYYATLHQTLIGLETQKQLEDMDVTPDTMIGCVGGGSNFMGFTLPFIKERIKEHVETEFIAAEPTVVPVLTKGEFRYDYSDSGEMMPMVKMYTLGHNFIPPEIHAGGLRYHGKTPVLSLLTKEGIVKPKSFSQEEIFSAGRLFARLEGILPAPESSHAIQAAIIEAKKCRKERRKKTIVFCLSGHGMLDLSGYENFQDNTKTGVY